MPETQHVSVNHKYEKNRVRGAVMNCMKAQTDLLERLSASDPSNADVWLAVSGCIEADDEHFSPLIAQAINHVANCPACQNFLDSIDPSRITARERAKKYCCAHMHGAVDGDGGTKFSFAMFRNENACWCINDDYAFARFCPWCGKVLPDGPFE